MERRTKIGTLCAIAVLIAAGMGLARHSAALKTAGRGSRFAPVGGHHKPLTEPVEAASEDSFPASDSPAWTGTTAL